MAIIEELCADVRARKADFTASWRKRLERDWVQVENTRMKGWINSQFVALKSCNKVELPWSRC